MDFRCLRGGPFIPLRLEKRNRVRGTALSNVARFRERRYEAEDKSRRA
jgi:hypothetical protein